MNCLLTFATHAVCVTCTLRCLKMPIYYTLFVGDARVGTGEVRAPNAEGEQVEVTIMKLDDVRNTVKAYFPQELGHCSAPSLLVYYVSEEDYVNACEGVAERIQILPIHPIDTSSDHAFNGNIFLAIMAPAPAVVPGALLFLVYRGLMCMCA